MCFARLSVEIITADHGLPQFVSSFGQVMGMARSDILSPSG